MTAIAYNQTSPTNYITALHRSTDGYITLFKKVAGGKVMQRHFKTHELTDDILNEWVDYDSYMSLNSFYRPMRGNKHLRTIHNLYVDIDCYNANMSVESVLYTLEKDFYGVKIPQPNIVLYSGRGLCLVWHIEAISGLAIEKWQAVQRAIYSELKQFGADPAITSDAARVFRLPASVNSKNNEVVRYDVLHSYEYDLAEIGKEYFGILPQPKREYKPKKAQHKPVESYKKNNKMKYLFTPYSLQKARLADIETLIEIRGGKCEGHRERLLFLARYYALRVNGQNEQAAIQKIEFLNGLFDVPLKNDELVRATASAETYVKESSGINVSNATLIEWFGITADEQAQLTTIISKSVKRERDRIRAKRSRRERGGMTRAEYNAKRTNERVRKAKRLKLAMSIYPTASQRTLASKLGLSKTTILNLLRDMSQLLEQVVTCPSAYVKRECPSLQLGLLGMLSNGLLQYKDVLVGDDVVSSRRRVFW